MTQTRNPAVAPPPDGPFHYAGGTLHCEQVPLDRLAAEHDTPCFVYSGRAIDAGREAIDQALSFAPHLLAYAVKANGNLAILARLAAAGCGADIVSGGELRRCLEAGFSPERIIFSGVGKRDDELEAALDSGIRSIHVESPAELDAIEHIAARRGARAPIGLRVNPDVDPNTHPYIATGLHNSKFGIDIDAARALLPRILGSDYLQLEGIACHIGSQLPSPEPLAEAVAVVARFARECREAGAPVRTLDAGGGWPLSYGDEPEPFPPYEAYGAAIRQGLEQADAAQLGFEIIVEPGRSLIGNAGVLLTRVVFIKDRPSKRFVVVDAAMTELLRPALYQAHHPIVPVREPAPDAARAAVDVVGPVCESSDFLALDRALPELQRGDLLAIGGAGAYAASMASTYNARPRAAELLVDADNVRTVRERETIASLWTGERR